MMTGRNRPVDCAEQSSAAGRRALLCAIHTFRAAMEKIDQFKEWQL
ncbi:MAG: hypothetical protein ABSF45_28450 [Terriglobia bacterium]|jgi:signal recognition particle GTPase